MRGSFSGVHWGMGGGGVGGDKGFNLYPVSKGRGAVDHGSLVGGSCDGIPRGGTGWVYISP